MQTLTQPGNKLQQARLARHWSQAQVAAQIGSTRLSVSRWERGQCTPTRYYRHRLATLFEASEADLFGLPISAESAPRSLLLDPLLPAPPLLIGRQTILAAGRALLEARGRAHERVLALHGLPGVGKTAVAVTLAHDEAVRARFPDGVLWAEVGPTSNPTAILHRWSSLLGLASTPAAELGSALRAVLSNRAVLFVLDDVWQLAAFQALAVGGRRCGYLLTTRLPNLAAHLTLEGTLAIEELPLQESLSLLQQLAPQVAHQAHHLTELVELVGGLPLALTLLGHYLRTRTYRGTSRRLIETLTQVRDSQVRLRLTAPMGLVPNASLQEVLSASAQTVSEQASAALAALSLFPAKPMTFSEEAALAVAGCRPQDLDALIDAGLLEAVRPDRYTLHRVIADYARLHLRHQGEAIRRLVGYVNTLLQRLADDEEAVMAEVPVILAAVDDAQQQRMQAEVIQIVFRLVPPLLSKGLYTLAHAVAKRAYQVAHRGCDQEAQCQAVWAMAECALRQGHLEQAETCGKEGLHLVESLPAAPRWQATFLLQLGRLASHRGDYAQAERDLQQGWQLAQRQPVVELGGALAFALAMTYRAQGRLDEAQRILDEGMEQTRQRPLSRASCLLWLAMGLLRRSQGAILAAYEHCERAWDLARDARHSEVADYACCALLDLLIDLGQVQTMRERLAELEQPGPNEDPRWRAYLCYLHARLLAAAGAHEQARTRFRAALHTLRLLNEQRTIEDMTCWMNHLMDRHS